MASPNNIRVKTMCLIVNDGKVLVMDGRSIKSRSEGVVVEPAPFYRAIGGSLEFGETVRDGVRREVREELNSEVIGLELAEVVESIFDYEGQANHEVCFIFKGSLERTELYDQDSIHVIEDTYEFDTVWVPVQDVLSGPTPLYPLADYAQHLS